MFRRAAAVVTMLAVTVLLPAALALGGSSPAAAAPRAHHRHAATTMSPGGVLIPANSHEELPLHGGAVTSLNWSGYAVVPTAKRITAVDSTFVVPSAGLVPPGFAATWTGIGGYSSGDLIQAGVAEQSLPTTSLLGDQYYAWYELLPGASIQLSGCAGDTGCAVSPGDHVRVDISEVSGSTWAISVGDEGHWSFSKRVNYKSTNSSAEWILEAPTIDGVQSPLAPTGTTAFGATSTYTAGGATRTIAQGDPTQIDLSPLPVAGLLNEATTSTLAADGQSFNDCAYARSCASP